MKTKKAAKHPGSLDGKARSSAKTRVPKAKQRKSISFQTRSDEIHDSLDDAIRKLESGDLSPESAKGILEKIRIVQTLLREATRELEDWLKK